jgi:outer membrane protein TolC
MLQLLFFLLTLNQVIAEAVTINLEEAVRMALTQSLGLKKNSVDLAQAEYASRRLWSEIFPSFSFSAGLTFLPATPLISEPGFQYRDDALSYALNLGLSFTLNPSISSSMKRIELAYRSQLLSHETASRQLEIQVVKNFLSLITMRENLSFLKERVKLAENKLNNDRIARTNGLLNELTWLNSQLSTETARYNLSYANGLYQNAIGEFLALLGIEAGTEIFLAGGIVAAPALFDPEELILEYLPKRPDILSQRQTIQRLELTRNITANAARSPTLELGTQWRGGSPQSGPLSDPFTDSLSGSVSLRFPVDSWVPGTRQSQSIKAADAEVEKARLDLQNTETNAKTQIRSITSSLNNTWESLSIARMRVTIAERTLAATNEGFRNGILNFQELEDRRNDLSDARQQLLQGELSYQTLLLDLSSALNVEWNTLSGQKTGNAQANNFGSMP